MDDGFIYTVGLPGIKIERHTFYAHFVIEHGNESLKKYSYFRISWKCLPRVLRNNFVFREGGGARSIYLVVLIIFNYFQNYQNADVTFYCSWKLKNGPVSIGEYLADMRKRREEKTIFKKFEWTIWVPGRPSVFFQTEC